MRLQTAWNSFFKPKLNPTVQRKNSPAILATKKKQPFIIQPNTTEQLRQYKLILEQEPIGLIITYNGYITTVNYYMRVFFNQSFKALQQKKIWNTFPIKKEMRDIFKEAEKAIQQHVPTWQTVAQLTDFTGQTKTYFIKTLLLNEDIKKPTIGWLFQDISSLKEKEKLEKNKQAMQQKAKKTNAMVHDLIVARNNAEAENKTKTTFLANVSHELRTPLNAILGFSEVIASETFGPLQNNQYRTYIGYIINSGRHLLSLINDILDLSRLESNNQKIDEKTISLYPLLEETMTIVSHYPGGQNRHISLSMPNKDILLKADERLLRQIFLNILSNAIKFTQDNGKIQIKVTQLQNKSLRLSFKDNGIGIPKDKINKLFQPFSQIKNAKNQTQEGSGLGLVLVKKMVERHQGSVQLKSKSGEGTNIIVEFPSERVIK